MNDNELIELTNEICNILDDDGIKILKDEPLTNSYTIITSYTCIDKAEIEELDEAIKKYALVSDILCFNNNFLHIELYPIH